MKKYLLMLLGLAAMSCTGSGSLGTVSSPDGRIIVNVSESGYSLSVDGVLVLEDSHAAMLTSSGLSAGNGMVVRSASRSRKPVSEHIVSPLYRQSEFDFTYNSLVLCFDGGWSMEWRVSDEGAAYRFISSGSGDPVRVQSETAEFNFVQDHESWIAYSTNPDRPYAMAFQNTYRQADLSEESPTAGFLPVTVALEGETKLTILESDLRDYPSMFVRTIPGHTAVKGEFAGYPKEWARYPGRAQNHVLSHEEWITETDASRSYPWRILAVSRKDAEMPVNNMVYALAEPSRIQDLSWIRPGFSAWEWWNDWNLTDVSFKPGINMPTYRHYIEFAERYGLEYLILDEGWYVPSSGDMLTPIPELDIPELVSYAALHNVKLILWTVFNVLDEQLEEACRRYSEMGIAGFKVDFLDRGDQTAVQMIWRIAEMAAKYHLMLDFHGIFPPTGLCRTYPNVVNYESVFGNEEVRWSEVDVNMPLYLTQFPFIRQQCGYTDYTPGAMLNASRESFRPDYDNSMNMGTRAQQVAIYAVVDSPLTMLCDTPSRYDADPETTGFIASLPRNYSRTLCTDGRLGEYVVMAREAADGSWTVGALTNWDARTVDIDFSFLPQGSWSASAFLDGDQADSVASDHRIEKFSIAPGETRSFRMASGGGLVIKIQKQ